MYDGMHDNGDLFVKDGSQPFLTGFGLSDASLSPGYKPGKTEEKSVASARPILEDPFSKPL